MSLKSDVLKELKLHKDSFLSGQNLADVFCVSRTAIWKSVCALREEGYEIDSITNKGYKFISETDVLSETAIQSYIGKYTDDIHILIYDTVESTNTMLKKMYLETNKISNHTLIIAQEQTNGRGRMGRTFYSPPKTGAYFSLFLKPHFGISTAFSITTIAAVAICKAIEELTTKHPGIKWINDIYLENKKVAGILTESAIHMENSAIDYLIIGIGINITTTQFPEELSATAGSLNTDLSRNQLIGSILHHFYAMYDNLPSTNYMKEYKSYSIMLDRRISYQINNVTYTGWVTDIDESGGLIVKTSHNFVTLKSGEVTFIDF